MSQTPSPTHPSPRSARLEAALEDQGHRTPDLTDEILSAAREQQGLPPRGPNRWLIAALLLLGLSIVPAIRWLQQRAAGPDDSVTAPQDPDADGAPLVVPRSPEELRELVRGGIRGISASVPAVDSMIIERGGHGPAPFLPMLGEGARTQFAWGQWPREQSDATLEGLMEHLGSDHEWIQDIRNGQASPHNRLDLHLHLAGTPARTVVLPTWVSPETPGAERWVWINTRRGEAAIKSDAFAAHLLTLHELTERSIQAELGIYKGMTLAEQPAAKRCRSLVLHRTDPEQLRALGGSTACRDLDVRASRDLVSLEGARAIAGGFPNLERLVLGRGMNEDAVAELTALEHLQELIFCDADEEPDGAVIAPAANGLGHGQRDLFTRFEKLRVLVIPGGLVDDAHLPRLPRSLERLAMPYAPIDGTGFEGMADHDRLQRVELMRCPTLSDRAFAALAELDGLRHLDVRYAVANGGLIEESGTLPFANNKDITPAALEAMARCSSLESLLLDNWFRDDMGAIAGTPRDLRAEGWVDALTKVAHMPALRTLSLRDGWCLEMTHLDGVRNAPNLRTLDLTGCDRPLVRELEELQAAMPWCDVIHPRLVHSVVEMRPIAPRGGDGWFDVEGEKERLIAWLHEHADDIDRDPSAIDAFHALPSDDGGPIAGDRLRWFPRPFEPHPKDPTRWEVGAARFVPVSVLPVDRAHERLRPAPTPDGNQPPAPIEWIPVDMEAEWFSGHDFAEVSVGVDTASGRHLLRYALREARTGPYRRWTESLSGRFVALLVEGRVESCPSMLAMPTGWGQIPVSTLDCAERVVDRLRGR